MKKTTGAAKKGHTQHLPAADSYTKSTQKTSNDYPSSMAAQKPGVCGPADNHHGKGKHKGY
jgi:hypothetical protein